MLKKSLALLLALVLAVSMLPVSVSAESAGTSGDCSADGDGSVSWTFAGDTLTISGNGTLRRYPYAYDAPWKEFAFTKVIIGKDVKVPPVNPDKWMTEGGMFAENAELKSFVVEAGNTDYFVYDDCLYAVIDNDTYLYAVPPAKTGELHIKEGTSDTFRYSSYGFLKGCDGITKLYLPSTLWLFDRPYRDFTFAYGCTHLGSQVEYYEVAADHPEAKSIDGVVYSKGGIEYTPGGVVHTNDGDSLWAVPGKYANRLVIADGTTSLGDMALWSYLFKERTKDNPVQIVIPASMKGIEYAFETFSVGTEYYDQFPIVVYGYAGTEAELAANKSGIPFVALTTQPEPTATPDPNSGDCSAAGDGSVSWKLANGVLTISGTGAMKDWEQMQSPWYCNEEITRVVIQPGVTHIGNSAFQYCQKLTSVSIPSTVKTIGTRSFADCGALTSVTIPNGVTQIGDSAFFYCTKLADATIPASVTTIGSGVFAFCESMKEITIPDTVTKLGESVLRGCGQLTSASLPKNITEIPTGFFEGTTLLANYTIPDGVTTIGERAFYGAGIISLTIPASVTSIKEYAFYDTMKIKDIYYGGTEEQWKQISIDKTGNNGIFGEPGYLEAATVHFTDATPAPTATPKPTTTPAPTATPKPTATPAPTATPEPIVFTDVKDSDYYAEAVAWAVARGITNGIGNNRFGPSNPCTRGQIVTFLWNAAGKPEPKSTANPFTDVKSSDYFSQAVLWAAENKIVNGTDATHFSPNQPCTRGMAVTLLWRFSDEPQSSAAGGFTDVKASDYFAEAVAWAAEKGITTGTGNGKFSPNVPCTRSQIVTFLYRAIGE